MNYLDYKFPIGFFKKTIKFIPGHISIRRLFSEVLTWLKVPHYDCVCPDNTSNGLPISVNPATGFIQRYDPETNTWVDTTVSLFTP